jgi:phosphatidylinositol 4-phosphatase
MKRLFARVSKPSFSVSSPSSAAAATTNATSRTSSDLLAQIPGLSPKFTVPAMPHPCPHDHLALLPTSHGLLVRPHAPRLHPDSHVRISWGKRVDVEEIAGDRTSEELDWKNAVIVYGIVGIVVLYDCMYAYARLCIQLH